MNRYRAYYPLDDAPAADGDGQFLGVNALDDPASLADGEVCLAVNARFDERRAATRRGIRIMAFGAWNMPGDGPSTIRPFGTILTAGTYADPISGFEWVVVVTADGAFRAKSGNLASAIPVAAGESLANASDLIQTYNGLVLLRGQTEAPLYLTDLAEGFKALPDPAPEKERLPVATQGIYFGNRLFVVDGRASAQYLDTIWVSDFGGVSSVLQGDDVYQSFKVNQGSADRLVGLYKFNDTTLVAAKERSIYVVSAIAGTNAELAASARLDEVTRQYGCISPRSFVQVGADVWFLGHRRGVCSIRQTETNALQGVDVPVSRPIQPIIDRINWEAARGAVAAAHENRVYFAVPIDSATANNAILVYSTLTQRWAGYDQSQATRVKEWVKFSYAGAVRLGFLSADGFICLMEDGYLDHTGTADGVVTYHPIPTTIRSRGYGGRAGGVKRFSRLVARVATSDPQYSVATVRDGVQERRELGTVTKSRTRYLRPHGRAAWDPTNVNGDWEEPYRGDYSIQAPIAPPFACDQLQDAEESWHLRDHGQFLQAELTTSRGRLEVAGLVVEPIRAPTRGGTNL